MFDRKLSFGTEADAYTLFDWGGGGGVLQSCKIGSELKPLFTFNSHLFFKFHCLD